MLMSLAQPCSWFALLLLRVVALLALSPAEMLRVDDLDGTPTFPRCARYGMALHHRHERAAAELVYDVVVLVCMNAAVGW